MPDIFGPAPQPACRAVLDADEEGIVPRSTGYNDWFPKTKLEPSRKWIKNAVAGKINTNSGGSGNGCEKGFSGLRVFDERQFLTDDYRKLQNVVGSLFWFNIIQRDAANRAGDNRHAHSCGVVPVKP